MMQLRSGDIQLERPKAVLPQEDFVFRRKPFYLRYRRVQSAPPLCSMAAHAHAPHHAAAASKQQQQHTVAHTTTSKDGQQQLDEGVTHKLKECEKPSYMQLHVRTLLLTLSAPHMILIKMQGTQTFNTRRVCHALSAPVRVRSGVTGSS